MAGKWGQALAIRLATAAVVLPLLLVLIWAPALRLGFALFVAALAGVGLFEYYAIVRARGYSPETIGGILAGTALAFSGVAGSPLLTGFLLYGGALLVSTLHVVRNQRSVPGLASSVFGIFYVGWFGAHFNLLHSVYRGDVHIGPGLVTLLIVAVVLTDSAAYFVGSRFGRHKVAPAISPNKSWEGAAGGMVFSLAGMAVLYFLYRRFPNGPLPDWNFSRYLFVGALLSAVAQVGDFAESAIKRDAGVKDSGALFPGHGGVLDRCDGFLFAAPVLYYFVIPWFAT